jgi:hypothetical protein
MKEGEREVEGGGRDKNSGQLGRDVRRKRGGKRKEAKEE